MRSQGPPSAQRTVFRLFLQVVLLNLLVAIMGETWEKIKENADDEWKLLMVGAIQVTNFGSM